MQKSTPPPSARRILRPPEVQIVEMSLRDGIQNDPKSYTIEERLRFLERLSDAGLRRIELGAFVSPKWVPQMANSREFILKSFELQKMGRIPTGCIFGALVPNEKGMREALTTPLKEVSVFTGATDLFTKKNINCTVEESLERFLPIFSLAQKNRVRVRAYISVAMGCPYEGDVPIPRVVQLAERLHKMGSFEVSIGDTIGVATPNKVKELFQALKRKIPLRVLAGHFHDTRNQAIANVYQAYLLGVRIFDSSAGGIGGCPYAPGSKGNVSTSDVAYLFQGMNVPTGIIQEKISGLQIQS